MAANLLQQDVTAERPNQRWVGDTSELRIGENGKAYLRAILDLYSRFVVGWAISAVNDRHLTRKALEMAARSTVRSSDAYGITDAAGQSKRWRGVRPSRVIRSEAGNLPACRASSGRNEPADSLTCSQPPTRDECTASLRTW
ncbi:MAG: DDE-type integrase/transposase/recombinase [Vicinamibacterales bacterium]